MVQERKDFFLPIDQPQVEGFTTLGFSPFSQAFSQVQG
jgi:hypothetical protein